MSASAPELVAAAPALVLRGVEKSYGARRALLGLSFRAPRGAITGLIGPNGAGKTTCFSIVAGLLLPDAGVVDVLGQGPYDARRQRGRLGALPQDSELPPYSRVESFLGYLARLQGLTRAATDREVVRVLELVSLRDRAQERIGALSHGMRRRVAVAQALIGTPALCLLDEPTSGLDPHLVAQLREMLREQRQRHGMSLVVSSHVLSDLEAICDHIVFIEQGRTVTEGALGDVTERARVVSVTLERPPELAALEARLPDYGLAYPFTQRRERLRVELPAGAAAGAATDALLRALLELDAGVLELERGSSLEQVYLRNRASGG